MSASDGNEVLLAIDTATTRIVLALGTRAGEPLADSSWPAGYRHGETLLPAVERLLAERGIDRAQIAAVVVGTGPGAFTGLRVGIATAKGLAHGLGRPIVGVPTAAALLAAAARAEQVPVERLVLLLPAGPSDRIVVRNGEAPALLPAGEEPELAIADLVVALDLDGRAGVEALARGEAARAGMAAELLRTAAARLAAGDSDDLARLVPEYVTLPRGVTAMAGEVTWSHDRP
jgi:tRNA threonylcarbamoyl adenosine modification protein YeaZ